MAIIDYWIQLENRPWDCCPNGKDRMTGTHFAPLPTQLNGRNVYKPMGTVTPSKPFGDDALIYRRYTANWGAPDDRKVNPWDLNEPDPTNTGTRGTIPGPVIECNVGDKVVVHFRNMDSRIGFDVLARTHSMHPHGFVFKNTSDGAYPLSPPDSLQPVGAEAAQWGLVGVGPNKMGDRVPPGGSFIYTWETFGWPSTSGVWLYHDHSVCDMDNVSLGAIGIIVIHNLADTQNDFLITPADLPDGASFNSSPVSITCFPFPLTPAVNTLPHDLSGLNPIAVSPGSPAPSPGTPPMPGMPGMTVAASTGKKKAKAAAAVATPVAPRATTVGPPVMERLIDRGGQLLELDPTLKIISRFCIRNYRNPPKQALFLMLFHDLSGAPGMAINGRVFLGNTPTMVSGVATKMRFGVVGMSKESFHTFHIHGHRWIVPGPDGNNPGAIQSSPQVKAISQFEDTRTFGAANSFSFTIDEKLGSFMRAGGNAAADDAKGEWHMHCHVLGHMMGGMMGSLLIVGGGETAGTLPEGKPCPQVAAATADTFVVKNFAFTPSSLTAPNGGTVKFDFQELNHTVTTSAGSASPIEINNLGNNAANKGVAVTPIPTTKNFMVMGNPGDVIKFECGIHGFPMIGSITIV